MEETKIIYHIDDEETPYLVKLPIPPERVTLADFKNILNRPNFKFFFKSMDDDFGYVYVFILVTKAVSFRSIYENILPKHEISANGRIGRKSGVSLLAVPIKK